MYLARKKLDNKTVYTIRQSYYDGKCFRSRKLFDLGTNPERFVIYPGGNSYYIDEQICNRLIALGLEPDNDILEGIFLPFLDQELRRTIEAFSHKHRSASHRKRRQEENKRCEKAFFHIFDQRRMTYLRYGEQDQSGLARLPKKMFRRILDKSRDEIEQMFLEMEMVLDPQERKTYVFVIFDLARHFSSPLARRYPQALPQEEVDRHFIDELCHLHRDKTFWKGMRPSGSLQEYLIRYVCWFFDHDYAESGFLEDPVWEWIRRHRPFSPPPDRSALKLDEAMEIMEINKQALSGMTLKDLTRQYRTMAGKYHPDKGGDHEGFVKLGRAFEALSRKIRPRTKGKSNNRYRNP